MVNLRSRVAVLLYAALCLTLSGCGRSALEVQAVSATAVSKVANAALPRLVEVEKQEGLAAIASASSPVEAQAKLAAVRAKWTLVFGEDHHSGAWAALVATQAAWAEAILAADQGALGATELASVGRNVRTAYCAVRAAIPPPTTLPDFPAVPCVP